jgi:hypothetical protein
MDCTVFYSWQSDLPNATNRGFIQTALEKAARSIHSDKTINIEPVIDRDTKGVPGSPDIATTIFAKIERAEIFVCDVSIINNGLQTRPTPNPNVLIELGYALKTMGYARIVLVMNASYGGPELLPFDLRMKRVLAYDMPDEEQNRGPERKKLEGIVEHALREIFVGLEGQLTTDSIKELTLVKDTIKAIENVQPNQGHITRKFMEWAVHELESLKPDFSKVGERDDLLVEALGRTRNVVLEYSRVVESIAINAAADAAFALYKALGDIFARYEPPKGHSGAYHKSDYDFYKFLGHEMFVTLFALLIREGRYDLVADLLEEVIHVDSPFVGKDGVILPRHISTHVALLSYRDQRLQLKRVSIHADILNERHTEGELGSLVPMRLFVEADFFLFLREGSGWSPISNNYIGNQPPKFLVEAVSAKFAQKLLRPLQMDSIETFRLTVAARREKLRGFFGNRSLFFFPFDDFNPNIIGTR